MIFCKLNPTVLTLTKKETGKKSIPRTLNKIHLNSGLTEVFCSPSLKQRDAST